MILVSMESRAPVVTRAPLDFPGHQALLGLVVLVQVDFQLPGSREPLAPREKRETQVSLDMAVPELLAPLDFKDQSVHPDLPAYLFHP